MKKTNIVGRLALAAVALALTLGACQKEENNAGELKPLRIEVENQGTGGSKMETEGLQVYWNDGDEVGVKYNTYPITLIGGNACVENIPPLYNFVSCQPPSGWSNNPITFNAYYPPSIAAYDEEFLSGSYYRFNTINYGTGDLSVTLPSRYESSFADNRQRIQLPMIGTYYYYHESRNTSYSTTLFPMGREVLRFQHLTGALLVKVRNDSGLPLLVDRVAVSSGYYQLSGTTAVNFAVWNPIHHTPEMNHSEEALANLAANYYRKISVYPKYAETEADRQVEVVFPEPVEVAPGEFLPVQVPILPMGPAYQFESTNVTDNLTIRVEGRNESGTVGGRRLTFQHTVAINNGIGRNQMKTIQIKMDPASPRVTVSAPAFSVNAGNQVYFSQGNLQYNKATSTWSFMEHQWSTVETHDQDVGADYAAQDIVSLFGWGTSGHNYGPANYQPYSTSIEGSYGPGSSVLSPTGQSDWGCNAIANGGNAANSGWFTLSKMQWEYLLSSGDQDNDARRDRWTLATVNNVPGLLLLPDDQPPFTSPDRTQYTTYTYTLDTWQDMEALGAVFLPAAGTRSGTTVTRTPESAPSTYWTSEPVSGGQSAYALFIVPGAVFLNQDVRDRGSAVRLVRYAQ